MKILRKDYEFFMVKTIFSVNLKKIIIFVIVFKGI